MSKLKKDIKWVYLYTDGCGPCQRVSPIIETILATGNTHLKKIKHSDAPDILKRYGTPAVVRYDFTNNTIESEILSSTFWTGFMEIYARHNWMLSTKLSPVEFLVKLTSSNEDIDPKLFLDK